MVARKVHGLFRFSAKMDQSVWRENFAFSCPDNNSKIAPKENIEKYEFIKPGHEIQ